MAMKKGFIVMSGKENSLNKKSKILMNFAYIYITLPIIIFVVGWIKWYFALIIVSIIILSLIKVMQSTDPVCLPDINKTNVLKIFIALMIISILVFLSGIGKLAWQNFDHHTRNTIFQILVEDKWPLINYEWNPDGSGLIYYIGFWLPSAVAGKITNLNFGYLFQIIWAILGIYIVYMLICSWLNKLLIWPLLIFLFFSGLDIIGYAIANTERLTFISHIEWWAGYFQYTNTITQLFWVYNQSIPAWCITMLLYMQNNTKNLVFLVSLAMLSSTLPFLGLIPLVIFFAFTKSGICISKINTTNIFYSIKEISKDVFSFQNVLGGGVIGIISFLYLKGNSASQYIYFAEDIDFAVLMIYYLFFFLEAGIYLCYIYKYQKKNKLYQLIVICLCIIPLIKVGTSADFCMRASIPALLILILLIIDTIVQAQKIKDKKTIISLIIILLIGSITPIFEINRTIYKTYTSIKAEGKVENYDSSRQDVYVELNISGVKYSGDIKGNIFFDILGK